MILTGYICHRAEHLAGRKNMSLGVKALKNRGRALSGDYLTIIMIKKKPKNKKKTYQYPLFEKGIPFKDQQRILEPKMLFF